MEQKIKVIDGFLMPNQAEGTDTGHGDDQQHRASK